MLSNYPGCAAGLQYLGVSTWLCTGYRFTSGTTHSWLSCFHLSRCVDLQQSTFQVQLL
jgi:hypothetical protein